MKIYSHTFRLLAFMLLASCSLKTALALGGFSYAMPQLPNNTLGYSTQSGLQIKVDSSWIGSRGYWPFEVQIISPTASTADRQITVRLSAGHRYSQPSAITVEQDFELAQGDTVAAIKLLVPQLIDWNVCSMEVWVDGRLDKQLSQPSQSFSRTNNNTSHALFMPRRSEQIKLLGTAFNEQISSGRVELRYGSSELLDTWLDYSTVGAVIAAPEDLEQWETESPVRFQELLRWVRAGGNLWVVCAGSDLTELPDVERALGISDDLASGWNYLPLQGSAKTGVDALLEFKSPGSFEKSSQRRPWSRDRDDPDRAVDSRDWFVARAFGMGTVTVFRDPDGTGSKNTLVAVERSLLAKRSAWVHRHGNDPARGNYEFNNFLIPDVGMAPVFEFQVLISLFVIGIGPVNYWLLKRRGQLPLLLVTVPTAALAATLVLFVYGILSEGTGTRVRVQSFTMLDQKGGEAVCWARLSYYAGIAPAEGLRMPTDAAIYPILPSSGGRDRYGQPRELLWDNASAELSQHLSQGWLAARTPTQYLTITARPTNKQIAFELSDAGLRATNRLGVDVLTLAVQDDQGKFYLSEKIAAGESILLPASDKSTVMKAMRALLSDHEPQFPAGAEVAYRQRYRTETLSQNLMEIEIAALTSPMVQEWGSRTYVAVTAAGVELDLGLDYVTEQNSCHVIRGSW